MATYKPSLLFLKITNIDNGEPIPQDFVVHITPEDVCFLQNRSIPKIKSVNVVSQNNQFPTVYAVKFNDTTECSAAMHSDFKGTRILLDEIDQYSEGIKEFIKNLDVNALGWHYFSLGKESIKSTDNLAQFQHDISKQDRIDALSQALSNPKILQRNVTCVLSTLYDTRHFCQFGGGGDIYFKLKLLAGEIRGLITTDMEFVTLSPNDQGMRANSLLEGKGQFMGTADKIRYQLMANLVVACTKTLIDKIKAGEDLQKLQLLSCYGLACTIVCSRWLWGLQSQIFLSL